MKLRNNENGVSEIVGAMLILLILVVYLGVMQTYELPKWNKELEKQGFDLAYKDFLDLRSDIEDSSISNIPVTSSMHTGVRYPERFMLSNPGQGAYGVINTYPLRITISYNSNGTNIPPINYTSLGIVYEMKGISDFPRLVYEHGIIIKEFGSANYSDDENHIAKDNGIYIPILKGFEPLSSTEVETFNILPITDSDIINATSSINVTFETRYPEIWYNMLNKSIPVGSDITYNNTEIRITNIFSPDIFVGFSRNLSLPNTSSISENNIYSGTIKFADDNTIVNAIKINVIENTKINTTTNITNNISIFNDVISCDPPGRYMWAQQQGCLDIPTSQTFSNFIISNITTIKNATSDDLIFNVRDANNHKWEVKIKFITDDDGILSIESAQNRPLPAPSTCGYLINGFINLTDCYKNVTMNSPNALTITQIQSNILSFKILVT